MRIISYLLLFLCKKVAEKTQETEEKELQSPISVPGFILSLFFKKIGKNDYVEIIFAKPIHPQQILLMRSKSRDENSFMSAGSLRNNAKYKNGGKEVCIKLDIISPADRSKYFYCIHFYVSKMQYFSTEVFSYNRSSGQYEINRGERNWWLIGGIVAGVIIIVAVIVVVGIKFMGTGNQPIQQPDDDL